MNDTFSNRLNKIGLTTEEILSKINYIEDDSVLIYTSHLEGLGTQDSDFDIFVITSKMPNMTCHLPSGKMISTSIYLPSVRLDIEYRSKEDVLDLIERICNKEENFSNGDLAFASKLLYALNLYNESEYKELLSNEIAIKLGQQLKKLAIRNYLIRATAYLDDAGKFLVAREFECSLIASRNAIENAIGAINAINGHVNFNAKWIPKIFLMATDEKEDFIKEYRRLCIYPTITKDNFDQSLKDMISFAQDLCSYIAFES